MKSLWHQLLLVACVVPILYSIAVLVHVAQSYDLRLYPSFTNEDGGAKGIEIARVAPEIEWYGTKPRAASGDQPGDRILSLPAKKGTQFELVPVPTFPHFMRAMAKLNPKVTDVPRDGILPDQADPSEADADKQRRLPPLVEVGDDNRVRWVKIEFIRAGEADVKVAWLRLQATPISSLLISVAWFLLKMIIFVIGAVVVWKRPADVSARMFFMVCTVTVVAFMGGFHWASLLDSRWLFYPFIVSALLLPSVTLQFFLVFPQPHDLIRRWPRLTPAALYGLPGACLVALFACLFRINWLFDRQADVSQAMDILGRLIYLCLVGSGVLFVASLGILVHRFITSGTQAERNQVKWILFAGVLASFPIGYVFFMATSNVGEFAHGTMTKPMMLLASVLFTIAYAVSITRYKLMQAGRLINRGLLYFAISLAAMALFCLMVGVWALVSGTDKVFIWGNVMVVGLTAMLVLVLMGWAGNRFQAASELQFHREKYQLDRAMLRLGKAVDQLVDAAQLVQQMLQSSMDAVSASRGTVLLLTPEGDAFRSIARIGMERVPQRFEADSPLVEELRVTGMLTRWSGFGPPPTAGMWLLQDIGGELAFGLEGDSQLVGVVLLGPKEDSLAYTPEERNFLVALARITSLALESAQGHQTIERLREEMQIKVNQIAEQQQRILFLQGELLDRRVSAPTPLIASTAGRGDAPLRHDIRGSSPAVREMLTNVAKVARTSSSVLIRGESGTGKELLARAIHDNSPRVEGPFVQLHCAALSQGLLESELFGHVKGAFTGADRDKIGRFEMADCGTLFLDEIGDISPETQTKLLRVLQEQAFERVGGIEMIRVDVRLIAATHRNLEELIRQGKFREDLLYRLNVISLTAPPLRDRGEDVLELAYYFLRIYAQRIGKPIARIEKEALAALSAYSWPGNIRQLENAIERAVVLADGESLTVSDWPPEILNSPAASLAAKPTSIVRALGGFDPLRGTDSLRGQPLVSEIDELERSRLVNVLAECGGNKAQAARLLGIPRSTLFSKLRKHGLVELPR